ncbi:UNVERIFIED_CONTAM: hypothetical protein GTU68_043357 [Idotea baltica]|nr:hypothetical protein [Idotea baltica]
MSRNIPIWAMRL